jgi:MFS family permease
MANTMLPWVACILRGFLGITVGATSTVTPMYITELSPPDLRGAFGPLHQFGISCGATFCYVLGVIKQNANYLEWGKVAFFSGIPAGLHLILIWIVLESPAVARCHEIINRDSLLQRKFIKPLIISLLLMFFQQFGGTSAFRANLQNVFADSEPSIDAPVACLLVGIAGAVASLASSPLL